MNIIHISDLHFGNPEPVYKKSELKQALVDFIMNFDTKHDFVLVISGDITFQGSDEGFESAKNFFNDVIKDCHILRDRILVCPGNHDIAKKPDPSFSPLNTFIYSLRRDNKLDFENNKFHLLYLDDVCFLIINSAFHLDHRFGLVDDGICEFLEENESSIKNYTYRVAILHHHLLNQFADDISAVRNSYPFLYHLDNYNFQLVIHGHQHTHQNMPIGKSEMQIEGVRSFNYLTRGYPNGVNHYHLDGGGIKKTAYQFIKDKIPRKLILEMVTT
jgi:3',5'-cyclic AMP phosphodiesterase CpdA